jgi:hypothetical protein
MKRLLIGLGVLAMVLPVMATPIGFTENWDSYTSTNPPGGPWSPDIHMTVGGCFVTSANTAHTSPLAYRVNDATAYSTGQGRLEAIRRGWCQPAIVLKLRTPLR